MTMEHWAARVRALLVGAAWFSASAGPAWAQRPLSTDRPDFTESTSTVGEGVFQIEFGYTFGLDGSGQKVHNHSLGELLLRAGALTDRLELRVAVSPKVQTRRTGRLDGSRTRRMGIEDIYLGIKLALTEQNGILPATAILPQTTLPTGSQDFSADRVLPGVNLVYGWDIGETVSVAAGTQVNRAAGLHGNYYVEVEWAQSVAAAFGIGARHGLYAEWFARFRTEARWAEHYVNTGATWLTTDDLQWDVRVGFGLNDSAMEDFFLGTGMSVRIR